MISYGCNFKRSPLSLENVVNDHQDPIFVDYMLKNSNLDGA